MGTTAPAPRRSGPSRWARLALGAMVSVALTEGLLRVGMTVWARRARPNCGVRPELLARLQTAYANDGPSNEGGTDGVTFDAHRGFRHQANLRELPVHGIPVSTNSRGLRGAQEFPVPRPPGATVRIAALGDSFTFGEGVRDDETWPAQLAGAIPGTEVMNLGERAYAHDQMYFALRDVGLSLQPDVVILGFYPNDLWRDELTFYCAEKPRFSEASGGWRVDNYPVPAPAQAWSAVRRLPLVYAIPRVIVESLTQSPTTDRSGEERGAEALRRIREATVAAGARLVLVNLPDHPDRGPEEGSFFHRWCAATQTECVDVAPLFVEFAGNADGDAIRARFQGPHGDIHYSREGYRVVAEALRRHFAQPPRTRAGARPAAP